MLLIVRSEADLLPSLRSVNHLLGYRRRSAYGGNKDDLLGVWISPHLEATLAALTGGPLVRQGAEFPAAGAAATGREPSRRGLLRLRETISLGDVWALTWIEPGCFPRSSSAAQRRVALLHTLAVTDLLLSGPSGRFHPVFGARYPTSAITAEIESLRRRYPRLVSRQWLRQDGFWGLSLPHPNPPSPPPGAYPLKEME